MIIVIIKKKGVKNMFLFVFGLVWFLFSVSFLVIMILSSSQTGSEAPIFAYIIIGLFIAIGLYMLIKGIKKIIQNKKTEKYGSLPSILFFTVIEPYTVKSQPYMALFLCLFRLKSGSQATILS